jgi:hypothetical protein
MPQEPAFAAERRQDGEANPASERAEDRMSVASVRRRGMGSPDPHERVFTAILPLSRGSRLAMIPPASNSTRPRMAVPVVARPLGMRMIRPTSKECNP